MADEHGPVDVERVEYGDGVCGQVVTRVRPGRRAGFAVAALGDLDDDGVLDLAVGAPSDNDGGPSRGAIWLLFLNENGTVKTHEKISDTAGGFTGVLDEVAVFDPPLPEAHGDR